MYISNEFIEKSYFYREALIRALVRPDVFGSDISILQSPDQYSGYLAMPRWRRLETIFDTYQESKGYAFHTSDLGYNFLANIFLANRQANNILAKLGIGNLAGERALLDELLQLTTKRHALLFDLKADNYQEKLKGVNKEIKLVRQRLGRARGLLKRDFLSYWEKIVSGQDSLGRINQQAIRSKLVAAQNRLKMRLAELNDIYQKVQQRAAVTHNLIQEAERVFYGLDDFLRQLFWVRNWQLYITRRGDLRSYLKHWQDDLAEIDFNPFSANSLYIQKLLTALHDLPGYFDSSSMLLTRQAAATALRIVRIKRIQFVVEEALVLLSCYLNGQVDNNFNSQLLRKFKLVERWFNDYKHWGKPEELARYVELQQQFAIIMDLFLKSGRKTKKQWLTIKEALIDFSAKLN